MLDAEPPIARAASRRRGRSPRDRRSIRSAARAPPASLRSSVMASPPLRGSARGSPPSAARASLAGVPREGAARALGLAGAERPDQRDVAAALHGDERRCGRATARTGRRARACRRGAARRARPAGAARPRGREHGVKRVERASATTRTEPARLATGLDRAPRRARPRARRARVRGRTDAHAAGWRGPAARARGAGGAIVADRRTAPGAAAGRRGPPAAARSERLVHGHQRPAAESASSVSRAVRKSSRFADGRQADRRRVRSRAGLTYRPSFCDAEADVGPGREAGRSDVADHLLLAHAVADLEALREAREVRVEGDVAVGVLDLEQVSEAARPSRVRPPCRRRPTRAACPRRRRSRCRGAGRMMSRIGCRRS